MRWKAFGSADFIYSVDAAEDIVMKPSEVMITLNAVFAGVCPEWFCSNKFDRQQDARWRNPPAYGSMPYIDPWGLQKGKGGGTDFYNSSTQPDPVHPPDKAGPSTTAPSSSSKDAYEGRRVRLHGLEKTPEMNGKKGTLVEKMPDANWVIRLDGNLGDKIVKVCNLLSLSGIQLGAGERSPDCITLPPASIYVNAV